MFNVEQIDGLPETYYAKAESQLTPIEGIARAEEFFSHIPVTLRHGGNRAYYAQELDYVQMPIIEAFHDAESYYATLGHEFEGVFSIRSRERPCKDCQPGRSPADHNLE